MTQTIQQPITPEAVSAESFVEARSPWELFWSRFMRDKVAVAGLGFIVLLVLLAVFAPVIAKLVGHSANQIFASMLDQFGLPKGPSSTFWFGADQDGRDVFVRTLYGARTSLIISVAGTAAATIIGTVIGSVAGYYGGWLDTFISRSLDVVLSLPLLLFAIGISSVCSTTAQGCAGGTVKPGVSLVIVIIALFSWPYIARIVRGQIIALKEREFIQAAQGIGASGFRIMFVDLLPNLTASIIVYATLMLPYNVLFEAGLSYLGVGVPETTPSWGRMLADATNSSLFTHAWWMMVFPGIFLLLTTLAFNLVGDGLRDALTPGGR